MIASIQTNSKKYQIDLTKPIDISIPLRASSTNVSAFYVEPPVIEPIKDDEGFLARVSDGAAFNFNTVSFTPHGHGTHTECVGYVSREFNSVNENLKQFFFLAEVITVAVEKLGEDLVISKKQLQFALGNKKRKAVVIRTIPNTVDKLTMQYSHTNPPYLLEDAAIYLREKGVEHLLVDLPSLDKEKDDGELLAHHAFWNTQGKVRKNATITELIYVQNFVQDGTYFLNLQIAPFENDATPSKPILYEVITN
ncbi:N-formylkynurenine (Aryl-) formamidase [Formosa agariphila KMM 3901]|uniref:N-formylkynurenine (Aryl-) formamidase n=1 Tax=Formosa agariphila (strain DSM 15362 / KCTC 12365 / LMG 23005 / KMM 3901 / M-2Alg 35-1) TaxID=1347342 RepID=T2KPV9_FORAG|nr:cyclase family protein [Formosa agariphila]CDF80857.1 N-formylkynurenine (Aryl-) formamidase [Formosa agariphila KMM 3901]